MFRASATQEIQAAFERAREARSKAFWALFSRAPRKRALPRHPLCGCSV